MKIWTRITLVTSAVVVVALVIYAALDLSRNRSERRRLLEAEARQTSRLVQSAIEAEGLELDRKRATALERALQQKDARMSISIIPLSALTEKPPRYPREQLDRLNTVLDVRAQELRSIGNKVVVYTHPIREPDATQDDGVRIVGVVEVSRSLEPLDRAWRADLRQILPVFAVILGLMVAAILVFTRKLVTMPIQKLIAGMDDVASGDLSRVLLSEREDEIGALASRFNEMTTSLRESREETQRQNEARHHLEEQLSQTEKLATIGQLAAEIAHEVGTPLNVIAGRARTLAKKSVDPEAVAKNSTIIAEQATRITRIIQRLLDFARRKVGTVEAELVNLNQVALTTMDFLESRLKGAKIRSTLSREEGLCPVKGHPDQLQQVLINLLLNAVDAAGEGGLVRVETYSLTRRRPGLEMEPEQPYAVVAIHDSGPGIPPEAREKIFEPFYTSKESQGGTGLGLAVSYGIIKTHDGWIEVDDSEEGGSVFRLFLPSAEASDSGHADTPGVEFAS